MKHFYAILTPPTETFQLLFRFDTYEEREEWLVGGGTKGETKGEREYVKERDPRVRRVIHNRKTYNHANGTFASGLPIPPTGVATKTLRRLVKQHEQEENES